MALGGLVVIRNIIINKVVTETGDPGGTMSKRRNLAHFAGDRRRFRGTFARPGVKRGWTGQDETTVLLQNVTDVETGAVVTGHLWFNLTKGFEALNLAVGDVVEFEARVTSYTKGYQGRRAWETGEAWTATDWHLSRPTRARKLGGER